jgi:hypothetical protein
MLRLADPLASAAVLIGTASYDHLGQLPAVANNLARLETLLTADELWGLPSERCVVVAEPATIEDFMAPIEQALDTVTDTFLFYYAGHGILHPTTEALCLGMPQSDLEHSWRSMPFDTVRDALRNRTTLNKIVILDCCYSGSAYSMSADPPQLEQEHVRVDDGTYVMTASSRTHLALTYPGESHSAFTAEIVAILEAGLPLADEYIGLQQLYEEVKAELLRKKRPKPEQHVRNSGATVTFARNKRFPRTRPALPAVAEAPPVPAEYASIVRRPPRSIMAAADQMELHQATQLLSAAGTHGVPQGVAALLDLLVQAGQEPQTQAVLHGAALRHPADLVTIASVLGDLGQPAAGRLLFDKTVSGLRTPADIADIATVLKSSGSPRYDVEEFLTKGMLGISNTGEMVELIEALWATGLGAEATALIGLVAELLPHEAAILADRLLDAGQSKTAFAFYRRSIGTLARRTPAVVAQLVTAMRRAHQADIADALLAAVARRITAKPDAATVLEFMEALRQHDAADDADQLTALTAGCLHTSAAVTVAAGLRELGDERCAYAIVAHHALTKTDGDVGAVIAALNEAGRPADAFTILRAIGERSDPPTIPAKVTNLRAHGLTGEANKVLEALTASRPARVAEAMASAYAGRNPQFPLWTLEYLARRRPTAELVTLIGELAEYKERAFLETLGVVPTAAVRPFFTGNLRLNAVAVLELASQSQKDFDRLVSAVQAHDPDLMPWLSRQVAGVARHHLGPLIAKFAKRDLTGTLAAVLRSFRRLSAEDAGELAELIDKAAGREVSTAFLKIWVNHNAGGVAGDLLAGLLRSRRHITLADAIDGMQGNPGRQPGGSELNRLVADTILADEIRGKNCYHRPHPSQVPRAAHGLAVTDGILVLLDFRPMGMFGNGFLAFTPREAVFHPSSRPGGRVRYGDLPFLEISHDARGVRLGEQYWSLVGCGVPAETVAAFLRRITLLVSRGLKIATPERPEGEAAPLVQAPYRDRKPGRIPRSAALFVDADGRPARRNR